jgi:signal peptidase I
MEPFDASAPGAPQISSADSAEQPAQITVTPAAALAGVHRNAGTSAIVELCESLLITILLALFATTFVVQAYKIPSESMEPTLLVGDHVIVNKFIFEGSGAWYEKVLPYRAIRRGDIIIFKYPYEDHPDYVKRVIGLPGDRIRIVRGRVSVNEQPLDEPYAVHERPDPDDSDDNFPPLDPYTAQTELLPEWAQDIPNYIHQNELVVPANHYFVMGDNRDDSQDSRYWGFVDRGAIMGEPVLVYWSVEATSDDYLDRTLLGTIEGIGQTLIHLPSRTRWHRLLRRVR